MYIYSITIRSETTDLMILAWNNNMAVSCCIKVIMSTIISTGPNHLQWVTLSQEKFYLRHACSGLIFHFCWIYLSIYIKHKGIFFWLDNGLFDIPNVLIAY